jgi:hypothetical protein
MACVWALVSTTALDARDLGVLIQPIHQGKWTSSLLYEDLKVGEDFDARGHVDFKSQVSGAQFTYGLTDQLSVGVKGGVLVDPQEEAQGSQWQSRAGYLYGVDLYNEVFPATSYRPGVQISGGVSGFQVPLDRTNLSGSWQTIDQKLSGADYHASVLLSMKWPWVAPYTGVRLFGREVNWHDNNPAPGQPANIVGHAHGNASIVFGCPVRITPDLQFQAEGIFVNETMVTAGFRLATF